MDDCTRDARQTGRKAGVLLEDLDSLTRETMVSRSAFLGLLDGLPLNSTPA